MDKNDVVDFRLPLRGAGAPFLTPTARNVFNRFSTRFFLRVVIQVEETVKFKLDAASVAAAAAVALK